MEAQGPTFGAEVMARHEDWNWFGRADDGYQFQLGRVRIDMKQEWARCQLFVQPQYVAMANLPNNAVRPPPAAVQGMGGLYYAHNGSESPSRAGFHQAWMQVELDDANGWRLRLGRTTYGSGLEHLAASDGPKFNSLKNMRLGDRLLSSFEWSAFARAFDGVQLEGRFGEGWPLTVSWFYPTQGGWEQDFNQTMDDVRVATIAITAAKDRFLPGGELGLFFHDYSDTRACSQRVDNSGQTLAAEADLDVRVAGAHLLGIAPLAGGQFDYLFWGTVQWGDWYELDHLAYALALEGGYQWTHLPLKPWLRSGYFLGSGDSDPSDGTHGTFFQLAPGTRKYQLFPYYDLQNIEYVFAQLLLFPHERVKVRLDYSYNNLANSHDRWYMGTGPTQNSGSVFGYLGRPSGGQKALSQEASLSIAIKLSQFLSMDLFYAHAWGGDVIRSIYPDDPDADYASVEATFSF